MTTHNCRFKDTLIALAAATRCDVDLQRIQLQKFIYLHDVFSAVWREIAKPPRFHPYDRGPYDKHIQNAVDALAFRGLVDVTSHSFQAVKKTRSTYRLSRAGERALGRLIATEEVLHEELLLAIAIAREVSLRGWDQIVKIVYAEPTYYSARVGEDRRTLPTNQPSRNQVEYLASLFRWSWERTSEELPSRESFVQMLFIVIDEFRSSTEKQFSATDEIANAV